MAARTIFRRLRWGAALLMLGAMLTGCAVGRPKLIAAQVGMVRRPDRFIETTTMWKNAKPLTVQLRNPAGATTPVTLRAVHDGGSLSVLAIWPDLSGAYEPLVEAAQSQSRLSRQPVPTDQFDLSVERRTWIWDKTSRNYYLQEIDTDMFAFQFHLEGDPAACMMSGGEGRYDVWIWRAGWTHVFGYAEDKTLIVKRTPPEEGEYSTYPAPDAPADSYYFFQWIDDEGRLPWRLTERPDRYIRPHMYGFAAQKPVGSAGDVLAEGIYQNQTWLVEFKRKFQTGRRDDYQFKGTGPHPFAIALTDDAPGQEHFTSGLIDLYLD